MAEVSGELKQDYMSGVGPEQCIDAAAAAFATATLDIRSGTLGVGSHRLQRNLRTCP